jgi:hypothetical protein
MFGCLPAFHLINMAVYPSCRGVGAQRRGLAEYSTQPPIPNSPTHSRANLATVASKPYQQPRNGLQAWPSPKGTQPTANSQICLLQSGHSHFLRIHSPLAFPQFLNRLPAAHRDQTFPLGDATFGRSKETSQSGWHSALHKPIRPLHSWVNTANVQVLSTHSSPPIGLSRIFSF